MFINKKWINSALNCEVYFSFEGLSSDYSIVTAKIHLSQHKNKKQTVKTTHYEGSSLTNRDTETVINKFNTLQEISETYSR